MLALIVTCRQAEWSSPRPPGGALSGDLALDTKIKAQRFGGDGCTNIEEFLNSTDPCGWDDIYWE